jgi:hypothetical protein
VQSIPGGKQMSKVTEGGSKDESCEPLVPVAFRTVTKAQ